VIHAVEPNSTQGRVPLTVDLDALRSHKGLSISGLDIQAETLSLNDGKTVKLKHYTFRFFSQRFLEEDWFHAAHIWIPEPLQERARGKLFLASHVVNQHKYPEVLFDGYGRRTAAIVGVPSMVILPNPVNREFFKRTGLSKESQWQEETFKRFRATGNANEVSFAGIMKAKWRAIAAAEKVLGTEFDQVILAGGSKGGASVRAMLKYDPRIVSVVASGSIPFGTPEMLARLARREPLVYFLAEQFKLKPEDFQQDSFFTNLGTNDFNAHPTSARKTYESYRGDVCMYVHPNGGHPAMAPEQVKAMQLWLTHVFFGTQLPEIHTPTARTSPDGVSFSGMIEGHDGVTEVELCWTSYEERPWAGPNNPVAAPHMRAQWRTAPMDESNGMYTATLSRSAAGQVSRLHYFVRARVTRGGVEGYLSTPVQFAAEIK